LRLEVVAEQRRMEEALVGQVARLFVDRPREQGELERPDEDLGALSPFPIEGLGDSNPAEA